METSQSRYGIMEKLNQQMIQAKEELTKLEKGFDDTVYATETDIFEREDNIKERKGQYEHKFLMWKREKEVSLRMIKESNKQKEEELQDEINNVKNTYQATHQDWVVAQQAELMNLKKNLKRYREDETKKQTAQKQIISQIESGIKDLKDISAEQKEK